MSKTALALLAGLALAMWMGFAGGLKFVGGLLSGAFGLVTGLFSAVFGVGIALVVTVCAVLFAIVAVVCVLFLLALPVLVPVALLVGLVWLLARRSPPPPVPSLSAPALPAKV